MNEDYFHEAYGATAADAAKVGMEDAVVDAFNEGSISEERAKELFKEIDDSGTLTF